MNKIYRQKYYKGGGRLINYLSSSHEKSRRVKFYKRMQREIKLIINNNERKKLKKGLGHMIN